MRDIKFRAWDKKRKRMGWVESLAFNYKNELNGDNWLCYSTDDMEIKERPCGDYREKQKVVLMQYTGLKDKNGKEIYENDILSDGVINYVVAFYAGAWCLKLGVEDGSWYSLYPVACQREIVGNIYEKPELLSA